LNQTAVILINTGTPSSPGLADVRKFLSEFLDDKRVIDLPVVARKLLVRGIIVPFRAPKSAKLYRELWTEKGSPLLYYSMETRLKLQRILGEKYRVYLGMRYGNPSLKDTLERVKTDQVDEICVLPLYPQYASATSGSAIEYVFGVIRKWEVIPRINIISGFYDHPGFVNAFSNRIRSHLQDNYDHILFSYHGLPLKQVFQSHSNKACETFHCTSEINDQNKSCYQAACYQTSRLLAAELGLSTEDYTVCFQSRLSNNWLHPYTDEEVKKKAREGMKRLLVASPSFVSDCLETVVEIDHEYKKMFKEHGGQHLQLVESLNNGDDWIRALHSIIVR